MSIIINDMRGKGETEAVGKPGEPYSPEKWEAIELWTFMFVGGTTATYPMRTERNEGATINVNAIDQTPVEIMLTFRTDDGKNEVAGGLRFPVANLLCWGLERTKQRVYEKGESPLEKELERLKTKEQERASLFEKRAAEREAQFDAEMRLAEGK